MTEHELDRQLRAMQGAVVEPPLVTESDLPIVRSSKRGLIAFILIVLVLGGFLVAVMQDGERIAKRSSLEREKPTSDVSPDQTPRHEREAELGTPMQKLHSSVDSGVWQRIRSVSIPSVELLQIPGRTGITGIELSSEELERMGIYFDSVMVATSFFSGGCTFDTSRATLSYPILGLERLGPLKYLWSGDSVMKLGGRIIAARNVHDCRPVGYYAVLQSTIRDTIDKIAMISGDGGMFNSHQKSGVLAAGALVTLSRSKMPIDELLNHVADAGQIKVPLKALLIPLRLKTPWVRVQALGDEPVRMDVVFVFLASQECLAALPDHIRSFVESEYRITLDAIEDQLTQEELCDRLNAPSAFGVCPADEGTFSILSIGPIPARDLIRMQIRCQRHATITVSLIDQQGQVAFLHQLPSLSLGVSDVSIPLSGHAIPRGAYTMVVTSGEESATRRILID